MGVAEASRSAAAYGRHPYRSFFFLFLAKTFRKAQLDRGIDLVVHTVYGSDVGSSGDGTVSTS